MNYSLEYLIELAKRTGDRVIVHDSVMGEAFVIMPLASYEEILSEKKYLQDEVFEPESDADVLNRINSEIDAWRERQTEEAMAEWLETEAECDGGDGCCECGGCHDCAEDDVSDEEETIVSENDEIDADEEPMYHEIVEEPRPMRMADIPAVSLTPPLPEPAIEHQDDQKNTLNSPVEVPKITSNEAKFDNFTETVEEAPWEKFKKMGAPISAEELGSIPETTDFSEVNFVGEPVDSEPVFFDEPIE